MRWCPASTRSRAAATTRRWQTAFGIGVSVGRGLGGAVASGASGVGVLHGQRDVTADTALRLPLFGPSVADSRLPPNDWRPRVRAAAAASAHIPPASPAGALRRPVRRHGGAAIEGPGSQTRDAKDTDENYLAVWQARETVENGLRLGAVGNLISTTVLRATRTGRCGCWRAVSSSWGSSSRSATKRRQGHARSTTAPLGALRGTRWTVIADGCTDPQGTLRIPAPGRAEVPANTGLQPTRDVLHAACLAADGLPGRCGDTTMPGHGSGRISTWAHQDDRSLWPTLRGRLTR